MQYKNKIYRYYVPVLLNIILYIYKNCLSMSDKNVRISNNTHAAAAKLVQEKGMLLGKFVDNAIKEKVDREIKKKKL